MRSMWNCFFLEVGFMLTRQRDVLLMIREFFLHLPFHEKCCFLWFEGCVLCCGIFGAEDQ